jgi:hypothetical protein
MDAGQQILARKFPKAALIFVAGSVIRGEGTASSDLDLVVVFPKLKNAFRESFYFGGWPIEAFVHDLETLKHNFGKFSRTSGFPSLPQMVSEGSIVPGPSPLSRRLKAQADRTLKAGPLRLSKAELKLRRYFISDLMEDLRAPRNENELRATGVRLYESLADYYFRTNGLWSGKGKGISRAFVRSSPKIGGKFERAFESLFKHSEAALVLNLATEILKKEGGPLFGGYKAMSQARKKAIG